MAYRTDPPQAEIDGATLYVEVAAAQGGWTVTLLLARRPTTPIDGTELEVELFDADQMTMPLLDRPTGPLTEAGGSLGTTANAVFRFSGTTPPREVVVRWLDHSARFRLLAR